MIALTLFGARKQTLIAHLSIHLDWSYFLCVMSGYFYLAATVLFIIFRTRGELDYGQQENDDDVDDMFAAPRTHAPPRNDAI